MTVWSVQKSWFISLSHVGCPGWKQRGAQWKWFLRNTRVVVFAVNCCLTSGSRWVSSSLVRLLGCWPCRPLLLWWTNTMVFSINVAAFRLLLRSIWQISDAYWARGDATWLSIGCLLVVSLTDIDIIECCQIWHLRLRLRLRLGGGDCSSEVVQVVH